LHGVHINQDHNALAVVNERNSAIEMDRVDIPEYLDPWPAPDEFGVPAVLLFIPAVAMLEGVYSDIGPRGPDFAASSRLDERHALLGRRGGEFSMECRRKLDRIVVDRSQYWLVLWACTTKIGWPVI
jgi:hypothetical protein